jgi:6,7-dimethyl-8-ribityllumazine synthase
MPRSFEGELDASTLRVAVVASRFNDEIVSGLLEGALECLDRHGAALDDVTLARVPGAFEIPAAASRLARSGKYDAVIALGALIRGETPHFDFISIQVTLEISRVSIETSIPIAFGVITCNTMEQARHRIARGTNKGWEAALAAIEMANLFRQLEA